MATKTPETLDPSPGANPGQSMRRPPQNALSAAISSFSFDEHPCGALSPSFSRAPFGARLGTAAASSSPSPDEHPCVTLSTWWLVRVEGDERKIAVAGFTEDGRNKPVETFTSSPIVKRYGANTLEDEDGIVVLIHGLLSISRMREEGFSLEEYETFTASPIVKRYGANTLEDEDGIVVLIHGLLSISRMREEGFSLEMCQNFIIGFPYWWETLNSHIGYEPSSSSTSNSRVSTTQFYLENFQLGTFLDSVGSSFIENLLNNAKSFSSDDSDAFVECSYLSNGTPRFEEYTCGSDIPTKEKLVALNDGSKGSAAVCKEVDNMEIDLILRSTSQERGHVDIGSNVSLAPTEECTGDETYKEAGNQNDIMHPDTREQNAGSHLVNSDLISNWSPDHMPSDLEDGNTNAGSSVDMVSKDLLATVPHKRSSCCLETAGALENFPSLSRQRTPVAALNNQGLKRTQHIAVNHKTVGPAEQRCAHEVLQLQSPARSPMVRSPIPYAHNSPLTRVKANSLSVSTPESLKLRRTRSGRVVVPTLDPACQRIVYDRNGLVAGVIGLMLQSPLKGSKSETPARKGRARRASSRGTSMLSCKKMRVTS